MSEKVKILYFVDRMLRGGIQTFVLENIKRMNKEKVQIDFLLLDDGVEYELEKILEEQGSNVYKLYGVWLYKIKDCINYCKKLNEFFKNNNDYQVIHLHSSSKNFMVLYYAKKYGIKIRIAHSHNIRFQSENKFKILLGNILKILLRKYATHYFACSELAGEWLFGKKNVKVIHNAVDIEKFKFNQKVRDELRKELNIQDKLVIGHVGRFSKQKNHAFLIDIFLEIYNKNNNAVLLLVGAGEKEDEIKEKVNKLNLKDNVKFVGFKENVHEYMSAMDLFLFPSFFEGLPMTLIEAQANGLISYTSKDVVTEEAKVSELLNYISLNELPVKWAELILTNKPNRIDVSSEIKNRGYYIEDTAKELESFYILQNR